MNEATTAALYLVILILGVLLICMIAGESE